MLARARFQRMKTEKYLDGLPKVSGQLLKKSTKRMAKAMVGGRGPYLMYWGSENDTGKPSPGKKAKMLGKQLTYVVLRKRAFYCTKLVSKKVGDSVLFLV